MKDNEESFSAMIAMMQSGLSPKRKIDVLKMVYTTLCEHISSEGYKITKDVPPRKASKEMMRFLESEEGPIAIYKFLQFVAPLCGTPEDVISEIKEMSGKEEPDWSRN